MKNNWSGNDISEEWLLQKYEDLLQKAKNQAEQECEDANDFSQQTKEIESIFDRIRQQKHDRVAESQIEEYIPPIPWSEALDFDMGEITTMQKINNIELEIKDLLDALQTKYDEEKPSSSCEKACKNYNSKCLSLVPNVNQSILNDGFSSCMKECKKRDKKKIQCMENAKDCVAMTEVCWL